VHKLIRRARTAELCYLVRCFFEAVRHEDEVRSVTPALKGSISNFINRITLSLLEEGVMVHSSESTQSQVCNSLVEAAKCHVDGVYSKLGNHLEAALIATHGVYRGRLGSVVMAYSTHKHPLPANEDERALIATLNHEQVTQNASPKHFATLVKKHMPTMHPLTLLWPYKECIEFRRVCAMNAPIAHFIPEELKVYVDRPVGQTVPTRELLREIGALDDVHTKGKRSRKAWDEFLDKGMKVANETPLRLFGRSYTELEALYHEGKKKDLEDGVWDVKTPKKQKESQLTTADAQGVIPRHVPTEPTKPTKPIEAVAYSKVASVCTATYQCFESEAQLLVLMEDSKLLGFKNGTVIGELHKDVGSFLVGQRVFFKMGESYEDCKFAEQAAKWQEEVGLPFAKTQVVWVKPSLRWWYEIPTDSANKGDWSASLQKSLNTRIKRELSSLGYMPCLIASCFDGIRVTELKTYDDDRFGLSLIKNLLFAKHIGIKDVGPFNMIVANGHDVLLVDMGKPSTEQMKEYNTKGLFTSHKFTKTQKHSLHLALSRNYHEICAFMDRLSRLPLASRCDYAFWKYIEEYKQRGTGHFNPSILDGKC